MTRKFSFILFTLLLSIVLVGCNLGQEDGENVVNIYTDRHYDTDQDLYDKFTEETGIKVNVVKAKADELINRLETEGEDTLADVLVVADAGRLHRAKEKDLLQPIVSDTLETNIPEQYRDLEDYWFGLTMRARVIVYTKDTERVSDAELATLTSYQDLTNDEWQGRVLIRSSSNIYNQSLVASFIFLSGEVETKAWAEGMVDNFARQPEGNDRDQAKAIVAGIGDVAVINTYYVGKLLNSSDESEIEVGQEIGVLFPEETHVNVSGAGVVKNATNEKNAVKLIEYLSSETAQRDYAEVNYEYPVNPNVEASELLKSWGTFTPQDLHVSKLGEFNTRATEIMNEVGWE